MASKTIVALFDEFDDAVKAVRALENGGFQHQDTSLVANNVADRHSTHVTGGRRAHEGDSQAAAGAGTGATIGVVVGGGAGLLAGLGMLAIPGVGPVVAAGPLIALITGAGVGAAAGGILGGLVGMGVPEEDAHYYAEGVRRGGALVTAKVPEDQVERAVEILEQHDPADVEQRSAGWRDAGWSRFDERAEPLDRDRIEAERNRQRGDIGNRAAAMDMAAAGMGTSGMAGSSPAATSGMAGSTAVTGASNINKADINDGGTAGIAGSSAGVRSSATDQPSPADKATSTDATGIVGLPGSGRVRRYGAPTAGGVPREAFDRAAAGGKPTGGAGGDLPSSGPRFDDLDKKG